MSPRPRTVQDDVILDAAIEVLGTMGPEKMTLADVGNAVGLSAATLVQRFGSKRELMLALLRHTLGGIDQRVDAAVADTASPLDALFAAITEIPRELTTNIGLGKRLAFYLLQLEDPEFHGVAVEYAERRVAGIKNLLDDAVAAGELTEGYTNTAQLAETVYAMTLGSMMTWSVANEGTVKAKLRRDLDLLIRPFRRGPRKASNSSTDRNGAKASESMAAARSGTGF